MVGKGKVMAKKKSRLDVLKAALTPSWPSMARYAESGVCACLCVSFSCHFPATVSPLSHSLSSFIPVSLISRHRHGSLASLFSKGKVTMQRSRIQRSISGIDKGGNAPAEGKGGDSVSYETGKGSRLNYL